MSDIDMELKAVFDQRLSAVQPPPRAKPMPRRRMRVVAAVVAATVAAAGAGFVLDINAVAATSGADCASFPAKVQIWAQAHRGGLAQLDHPASRAEFAKMVADSGCSPHSQSHDHTHSGGSHH